MTPLTQEWVDKAEDDYWAALRDVRARKHPAFDSACFHSQQCAEKYLKARLQEAGLTFPLTHNLIVLLNLILTIEPGWAYLHAALLVLSGYAVSYRYPGDSADKAEARAAIKLCEQIRTIVRPSLGL
jgi:HEPN domain-containing protein